MLTQHHTPVSLSLAAYDLPLWSIVETNATLYQREPERFHLLLTEPLVQDQPLGSSGLDGAAKRAHRLPPGSEDRPGDRTGDRPEESESPDLLAEMQTPRLLWLEISPYRVIMTMQGNGKFSYRHFWERGVYGLSRYWLQNASITDNYQIRLRNFTRSLYLKGKTLPSHLRVEYELWTHDLQIGHYVMNVEIQH